MSHGNFLLWNVDKQQYISNFSLLNSAKDIFHLLSSSINGIKPKYLFVGPLHIAKVQETDTEFIALNEKGNIVIILTDTKLSIENIFTKAINIASIVQSMRYAQINKLYLKNHNSSIDVAYKSLFSRDIPIDLNENQEAIIVREKHEEDAFRQLGYLRKTTSFLINCVVLRQFSDNNFMYILQEWLFKEDVIDEKADESSIDITTQQAKIDSNTSIYQTKINSKPEFEKNSTSATETNSFINSNYCSNEYEIEIAKIDKQHQYLLKTFNDLLEAIEQNQTKEKLYLIIERLAVFSKFNFEIEENLLQHVYSDVYRFNRHKQEHLYFINSVKQFQKEYYYGSKTLVNDIVLFLRKWFITHIDGLDKDLVQTKFNKQQSNHRAIFI